MKTFSHKLLMIAVLSITLMACSKEEVKPFNSGAGAAGAFDTRGTTSDETGSGSTTGDQTGMTTSEETGNTGSTEGEGDGITDGGTSSDYDSKGTKRKPGKN